MKEPARIHINRLQDATSSLKHLKFGRGQEQKKDILKLTAEDSRLAYRLIKQTLDTMYQQLLFITYVLTQWRCRFIIMNFVAFCLLATDNFIKLWRRAKLDSR